MRFCSRSDVRPSPGFTWVGLQIARPKWPWLNSAMSDETAEPTEGEITVTVETEVVDVDGDGVVDYVTEVVTTEVDLDGDGIVDVIQVKSTTAYDLDGDGVPDVVETTTVTAADLDGDGELSEDEVLIESELAVREDLIADESAPE